MIKYEFWGEGEYNVADVDSINFLLNLLTSKPRKVNLTWLDEVAKNSRLLVAKDNNKIIGMATLAMTIIPTCKFGHIEDVVVDDKFRGQGIGTDLMKKLIIEAKRLRLGKIELTTRPTREEANKLYCKLGFEKIETNVYRMKLL